MIIKIEKINAVLSMLAIAVLFFVFNDRWIPISVGIGALISGFNLAAIYYIVTGVINGGGKKGWFLILAMFKLAILAGILFLILKYVPVRPAWFLGGLSLIVPSLIIGYARI